jgi:hypothetical protein
MGNRTRSIDCSKVCLKVCPTRSKIEDNLFYPLDWNPMERPKLTAIVTGAISLLLGIVYLILVQILDSREMVPAPIGLMLRLLG